MQHLRLLAGMWWVSVPRDRWPEDEESLKSIKRNWVEGSGDARQEMVFIGIDMDEAMLRQKLDSALLTDDEVEHGLVNWHAFPDPFEPWFQH